MIKIIRNRDNPATLNIQMPAGMTLADFDSIVFSVGDESYNTVDDAEKITVSGGSSLIINIGDVTQLPVGVHEPDIIGYSDLYDDGFVIYTRALRSLNYDLRLLFVSDKYAGGRPEVNPLTGSNGGLAEDNELYEGAELYAS